MARFLSIGRAKQFETGVINDTTMEDCEKNISKDGQTTIYTRNGKFVAKCVKTASKKAWYNISNKLHRDGDLPAETHYKNGQKVKKCWYKNGKQHRDGDLPAEILYKDGKKIREHWYQNGERHRDGDLPATIWYEDGQVTREYWHKHGREHRDGDLPADIWYQDGKEYAKYWHRHGELGGNVLSYAWFARDDTSNNSFYAGDDMDWHRNVHKGPLALELMRPLPIPIRNAIYKHYSMQ